MLLGLYTVLVCITTVTSGILRGRLFCLPRYFFPEGPAKRCLSPARATNLCLPHYRKRPRLVPSDNALILRTARPTHPVGPRMLPLESGARMPREKQPSPASPHSPSCSLQNAGGQNTGRRRASPTLLPHTFPDALRKGSGLRHAVIVSFSCDAK